MIQLLSLYFILAVLQLLFMNFKWARDIPSFQQLNSHNQKKLLQHSWSQLLILSLAQLPGLLDCQRMLENSPSCNSSCVQLLCDTVDTVSQLGLDGTEFTCLKALVLFNPHVPGLGQGEQLQVSRHSQPFKSEHLAWVLEDYFQLLLLQIEVLQDQTGLMLQEYCNSR